MIEICLPCGLNLEQGKIFSLYRHIIEFCQLDIVKKCNVFHSVPDPPPRHDKLRFHECCGSLVKLSNGNRTAERRRPLDEFNNGVVMTHRPLFDSELFEIRIDRLVDKWSGSIEVIFIIDSLKC